MTPFVGPCKSYPIWWRTLSRERATKQKDEPAQAPQVHSLTRILHWKMLPHYYVFSVWCSLLPSPCRAEKLPCAVAAMGRYRFGEAIPFSFQAIGDFGHAFLVRCRRSQAKPRQTSDRQPGKDDSPIAIAAVASRGTGTSNHSNHCALHHGFRSGEEARPAGPLRTFLRIGLVFRLIEADHGMINLRRCATDNRRRKKKQDADVTFTRHRRGPGQYPGAVIDCYAD